VDSPYLTAELLHDATRSIIQTRDGLLRAPVPRPIGRCFFVNDLTPDELESVLSAHKALCREMPRGGDGEDVFVTRAVAGV
jgi:3-dehydroquinate synthase